MNELKLVTQNDQVLADSRDVAEMVNKRHGDLIRDIDNYKTILDENADVRSADFFITSEYQIETGRTYRHYLLTKIGCDMVANKMTGEKGVLFTATYTKRFQEMEQELADRDKPSYMIDDAVKRAEKWITERKEYEALEKQRRLDAPYTNFGKVVSNSDGAISVGAFAKMMYEKHGLTIGRNKLFAWLRDNGYLIKDGRDKNNPKQQYVEQGLFEVKPSVVSTSKGDVEKVTTLITGKGQFKLAQKLVESEAV